METKPTLIDWVRMRWEKDTRYYEAYLHQDLWGDWVLTAVWGRRGTALGQVRNIFCGAYVDGLEKLLVLKIRREQRGYKLCLSRFAKKATMNSMI